MPRFKRSPVTWILGFVVVLMVMAGVIVLGSLGPISPYRQGAVRELYKQLDDLPPYDSSVTVQTQTRTSLLDWPVKIVVAYTLRGTCESVQSYYGQIATADGWTPDESLQRIHTDSDPSHDGLQTEYLKTSDGYSLQMGVECFIDQSYSAGYDVYLQTPPGRRATTRPKSMFNTADVRRKLGVCPGTGRV